MKVLLIPVTPFQQNCSLLIDEHTGKEAGLGQPGQIEVRGRVTPGYAGRSEALNADLLTADGYLRTATATIGRNGVPAISGARAVAGPKLNGQKYTYVDIFQKPVG